MTMRHTLLVLGALFCASQTFGVGLEKVGDKNPEVASIPPPTETEKFLADKLYVSTSFGWARASRSEGTWKASGGMSDITLGYHVIPGIFATYRYAPVAVAGNTDKTHFYRGIWDSHLLGALYRPDFINLPHTKVWASGEAGMVLVYMKPTDSLPEAKEDEDNGMIMALGLGADYSLAEKTTEKDSSYPAWTIGPKLHMSFGSMTLFQLAANVRFVF